LQARVSQPPVTVAQLWIDKFHPQMARKQKVLIVVSALGFIVLVAACLPLFVRDRDRANEMALLRNLREPGASEVKMAVPVFQIQITLSQKAAKKLSEAGESIKGLVIFDGDGHKKNNEKTAPERDVPLGVYEFERIGAGIVWVTNATISEEAFGRLTNLDYYFTVNVFSGRRVFKDNILDDGYAYGRISEAIKSPVRIDCDLLGPP
jgi:hypothetical protein